MGTSSTSTTRRRKASGTTRDPPARRRRMSLPAVSRPFPPLSFLLRRAPYVRFPLPEEAPPAAGIRVTIRDARKAPGRGWLRYSFSSRVRRRPDPKTGPWGGLDIDESAR